MARYSRYVDSGLECLGRVPEHWQVRQLGRIGSFFKGRGGNKDDEVEVGVPCIRYGDLYTQHRFFVTETRACVAPEAAAARYTAISYGDILFAGSGETLDEIGKSAVNLICGRVCCGGDVIVFRPTIDVNPRFLGYASDCPASVWQKACRGRGLTVMHVYSRELKYMVIALPPLAEQRAIVRFIDHADRRIQRYIRAKERLVELLEEQKRAIIHQAITGQIDVRTGQPYPAYKDAGVGWLREVPEHWDVRRGKTVFRCIDERSKSGNEELLTVSSDRGIVPRDSANVTMFKARSYVGHKLCRPGDLVINSLWAWSRGLGVSRYHGIVSTAYGVYRVQRKSTALPDFVHSLVRSGAFNWELRVRSRGIWISRLQLTDDSFLRAPLPLPPLPEQRAIVRFLDHADRRIQRHISATKRQIALLREYRTRLIADVVTGKRDVRVAPARLPETDPLARNRDRADTVPTESNLHPTVHDMTKEAVP